jgi:hypothetical protein
MLPLLSAIAMGVSPSVGNIDEKNLAPVEPAGSAAGAFGQDRAASAFVIAGRNDRGPSGRIQVRSRRHDDPKARCREAKCWG